MVNRDDDLDDEVRSHLRMAAEDRGEEAARREFGNIALIKEVTREMWGWASLDRLAQDLRYALRGLRRSPGFALTAVFSLALGIGANTAIFSLIDALLLRWLPVRDPQQLVGLIMIQSGKRVDSFSYPVVRVLAVQKQIFSGLSGFSAANFNTGPRDQPERVPGAWVSGEYYETLGLQPVVGRLLRRDDDQPGAAPVAVITDEYWQRIYGRDPVAVGRSILIEGIPVTIVGVSPAGFTGANVGQLADITIPLSANAQLFPEMTGRLSAAAEWLRILARPQPGISQEQAKARLAVVWPQLASVAVTPRMQPARRKALLTSAMDLIPGATGWTNLRGRFRQPLLVLMALVGMVLLIACANVANLLLARGQARRQEIAVRLAIGASRARLIRQLLTESLLLALLGALFAIAFGGIASRLLVRLMDTGRGGPLAFDLAPDWRVYAFTAALAIGSGILFGIAPALRSTTLNFRASTRTRLAPVLVAAQVAISLVLLIGAGLFVGTFENLAHIDPGFRHDGVLLVEGDLHRAMSSTHVTFYRDLVEQVERLPGVVSASFAGNTPLSGGWWTDSVSINGQPPSGEVAHLNSIAPRYFETMRTPLVAGRDFTDRDDTSASQVAIVNEAFVQRFLPGGHALGQHVSAGTSRDLAGMQIVGVVKDTISQSLREPPPPAVYIPFYQHQTEFPTLIVRASGTLTQVASALRREFQPKLPGSAIQIRALTSQVEAALVQERLMATLAAAFGTLALVLASIGLYGLLAYTVARRTSELGIRMALGANRGQVMWLVMRNALRLLTCGVIFGLPAAWAGSRLIASMLFGLKANDVFTMCAAVGVLIATGLLAGYLPARRASRVDPMAALRCE